MSLVDPPLQQYSLKKHKSAKVLLGFYFLYSQKAKIFYTTCPLTPVAPPAGKGHQMGAASSSKVSCFQSHTLAPGPAPAMGLWKEEGCCGPPSPILVHLCCNKSPTKNFSPTTGRRTGKH